jgi:hypothetical protein
MRWPSLLTVTVQAIANSESKVYAAVYRDQKTTVLQLGR